MFTIKNYLVASSLEEAYETLLKNRQNKVLGGTMWMRLGNKSIHTAIDLSKLGIDCITEDETFITIGAMCTLRQLETNDIIKSYGNGILAEAVKHIVGIQFRQTATVGGSVYSRFGFSDVLTALLAFDTYVELYKGGRIPLATFMKMPYEKDILINILIKKENIKACYLSERMSTTDLPILTVGVSKYENKYRIVVGSRPSKAVRAEKAMAYLNEQIKGLDETTLKQAVDEVVKEIKCFDNMRGSGAYRMKLTEVLVRRGLMRLED